MLVYWSVVLLKDPQKKLNGSKGDASIRPPKKMALFETNKKISFWLSRKYRRQLWSREVYLGTVPGDNKNW